ncbi:MAG: hypothetical protein ACXADX_12180 [Candidatus Hodarchaeales archaeon]
MTHSLTPMDQTELSSFRVETIKSRKQWFSYFALFIVFFLILLISYLYISGNELDVFVLLIFLLLLMYSIVLSLVWNFVGKFTLKQTVVRDIQNITNNKKPNIIKRMLFINFKRENQYFIARNTDPLDLNQMWRVLLGKYRPLFLTCMGASQAVNWALWGISGYGDRLLDIDDIFVIFPILIAPLLVSIFVPAIWTLEDARIKTLKTDGDVENIETDWRGLWEGLLGIGGFLGLLQMVYSYTSEEFKEYGGERIFNETIASVLFFLLLIAGVVLLSLVLYFNFYHEAMVNQLRNDALKYLKPKDVVLAT